MEHKTYNDYHNDVYFKTRFCGLGRTYHSDHMHGKRVKESSIPKTILPLIRYCEDFYVDKMITESILFEEGRKRTV